MILQLLRIALLWSLAGLATAAPEYPKLTGRVVDDANLLSPVLERALTTMLEQHESATTNQVVVVTIPRLGGHTIEEYGYKLGRHWGIGQKDKNNGVLLIVASTDRKVRIEVGYGLEGTLTDAIASNIIHGVILPEFRKGNFEKGIRSGTMSILQALGGKYQPRKMEKKQELPGWMIVLLIIGTLLPQWMFPGVFHSSSSSGGRSGVGGFSGGGGSFGGGGASGGW